MAAPKTSLNPKARPRTKTEEKTLRGRPVWVDNTGEVTGKKGAKYSEVTTTIPWGTEWITACLLYTSPSPRDLSTSRMPSSA